MEPLKWPGGCQETTYASPGAAAVSSLPFPAERSKPVRRRGVALFFTVSFHGLSAFETQRDAAP
jgi:hypothetical protein